MKPKVTIIIPVYNQEDLILRALESIPDRNDIEIIVIDDGSTDDTWKHLLAYREDHLYRNLVLLYSSKNSGWAVAANQGIDVAKGDYIVRLDSDDYICPDAFLKVVDSLRDEDMVYFNLEINSGDIWKVNETTKNTFVGNTKFMKRSFVGETRYPNVRSNADWFLYRDLMRKNPVERFTDLVVEHYNFPRIGSIQWELHNKVEE